MKYRSQYDLFDPEVVVDGAEVEAAVDPDAPDDAYTIGEHGNTVKAPDADARAGADDAPKPWVKPLAVVLAVLFLTLTGWNVNRVLKGPPPLPKPNAIQVKQTLYMGVMRIDAYRRVHNVTPETLAEADLPENAGYTYQRVDGWHYILGFQNGGPKLEYDSVVPKESFFGSPQALLSIGGTQ
jgi:hypothetical protein